MGMSFASAGVSGFAPLIDWGTAASVIGPLTLAPGATHATVLTPSGASPIEADLVTHRYHHHTCVHAFASLVWIMCSSALNNEDASGQMAVIMSSNDGGATWSAPAALVPPQSVMDDTTGDAARRICWPRAFVEYDGKLYAVVAVQSGSSATAIALLAAECKADRTLGTTFLVSPGVYTPVDGFPGYAYDAVLGPAILRAAALYGGMGGAYPGTPEQAWSGWLLQDGDYFVEPVTFPRDGSGQWLQRLWRKTTGASTAWWWLQESRDGGASWTPAVRTNVPNSPSAGGAIRLSDGRIAFAADMNGGRDPLYLALFNSITGRLSSLYAVRQGVSGTPTYAGSGKAGGAQYPGIFCDGTTVMLSYSLQKESVGFTSMPLAGLT